MGYIVHGILQARILEWVTFPFSRGSSLTKADSLPTELSGILLYYGLIDVSQ